MNVAKKLICCALIALAVLAPVVHVSANPRGGAVSGVHRAPAFGAGVHIITFNGGERADFSIDGDGDTTLNIVVKDALGNVVVRTVGPGDRTHVSWTPPRTGTYFIYVVNEGGTYNEYSWRAY